MNDLSKSLKILVDRYPGTMAELARQVTVFQLQDAARQLILDVDNAYVEVLLARGNLSVAQQNRSAFSRIVRISRERVRAGDLAR